MDAPVRALVVAEFYPREEDPVLGVWAHRQAVAVREAGVDVRVVVLQRVVPAEAELRGGARVALGSLARKLRQPRRAVLDGVPVAYVPFASPPRGGAYASWGAWAAPVLGPVLRRMGPFDVVHAHNAVPAADAVRRVGLPAPLVVSVHGGDVFHTRGVRGGAAAVDRSLGAARLVLANSRGIAAAVRDAAGGAVHVVPMGTDLPAAEPPLAPGPPRVATVAHLVARKRHEDVLRALAELPGVAYDVVGDGPERAALEALAATLGVADRVVFHGSLEHTAALRVARAASVMAMPSVDEAFGVAYVEAMAAGRPAIGCAGEPGPEDIAAAGPGLLRVAPRDPAALAATLRVALAARATVGAAARATVARAFTWERCGRLTAQAYAEAAGDR